jgi:hypothetical protein
MPVQRLVLGLMLLLLALVSPTALAQTNQLDLNDVSWLWPVPRDAISLANTLSMAEIKRTEGSDVWSDQQFKSILKVVESGAADVHGARVEFKPEFSIKSNWRVAGMRIDPTAPGAHAPLRQTFGSSVQIRLIIQPVTIIGGKVTVHDTAVHVVYSFLKAKDPTNPRVNVPDNVKFKDILADVRKLKSFCEAAGVTTNNLPLGVHPGFSQAVPNLRQEVLDFLGKHLSSDKLSAMALMGVQSEAEPWLFLALGPDAAGDFGPMPLNAPFAKPQMLDFRGGGAVAPTPIVNNRPQPGRSIPSGVSTNSLFKTVSLSQLAVIGKDDLGNLITDSQVKNSDIPDVIANPTMANFFNTDCVSCHTESQRRSVLALSSGTFAFQSKGRIPPIATDAVATQKWNVRNFGWFPDFFNNKVATATVTQRTANETAEVLEFIEANFAER